MDFIALIITQHRSCLGFLEGEDSGMKDSSAGFAVVNPLAGGFNDSAIVWNGPENVPEWLCALGPDTSPRAMCDRPHNAL